MPDMTTAMPDAGLMELAERGGNPAASAWKRYTADFDSMTDEQVECERQAAQSLVDENTDWLEAVAAWEAAGKPRTTQEPRP